MWDDSRFVTLLNAARAHGEDGESEDGATHEVGDLQLLFWLAWERLTPELQDDLLASDSFAELAETWEEDPEED